MGFCRRCFDEVNKAFLPPDVYEEGCYLELVRLAEAEGDR